MKMLNGFLYFLKRFWPFVLIGAMITLFVLFATRQSNLDVYTGGQSTYTVETETETEKKVITNTYMNSEINLSMQIPDGWTHVTKDGYDTYVHNASASSVQIQVMSYYPMVNNASADSLSQTYSQRGLTITEFQFLADNSYYLVYQSSGKSGITDYIELVIWDRSHVAKIVWTFNDSNYEKLKEEIWYCIDSISWQYEDPITEGFILCYQIDGDFEYAVPDSWQSGSTDTSFYAYEENTGASLTVNLLDDPTLLNDITQIDYANFLSNGKSNFVLNQFQQNDSMIYGEATYQNNDVQTAIVQGYFATGTYQYIVTYEYPVDLGTDYAALAQNGIALTRIFYSSAGDDVPAETETSNSVFIPDTLQSAQSETEPQSAQSETTDSQNGDGEVATFSEALMSVAGISQENADAISAVWDSLNAGIPTYAKAYMQSSDYLILEVTNDQQVNYYIYLDTTGGLSKICVNTEDGPVIYPN